MSYTAQFTKRNKLKILDENDTIITSFNVIANETDWNLLKPHIPTLIVDKFQERKTVIDLKEKETINSYVDLKRMGYIIISQRPARAWFKGQRVFFKLCSVNHIPKDCIVYDSIPKPLFIRYDYVNKLIRLEDKDRGRNRHKNYNTSPNGFGDWYEVKG